MQARFVSLAIGYSLVGGVLRRKGIRKRPWLELCRPETESSYLRHQVDSLRRACEEGFIARVDMVPGQAFYDLARARIHAPGLERVMELACPGGEPAINAEQLSIAGLRGLACAWLDGGRWSGDAGIWSFRSSSDARQVRRYLQQRGLALARTQPATTLLRLPAASMAALTREMRPFVHRSMRHALWPGSVHGRVLAAAGRNVSTH